MRAARAVSDLRLCGRVRARSARMAERWLDAVLDAVATAPFASGLGVEEADDGVVVRLDLAALLRSTVLRPLASEVADRVLELELRLVEDELSLRVGPRPSAGSGLAVEDLHALWRGRAEQVLFLQFDWRAGQQRVQEFCEMLLEREEATEELWEHQPRAAASLEQLSLTLGDLDPVGASSVTLDDELLYEATSDWGRMMGSDKTAPIPAELVRAVDPEGTFTLVALPCDELLLGILMSVLDRLQSRALRVEARGDEALAGVAWVNALGWEETFEPLFEYLAHEDSAVFEAGAALMMGEAAAIGRASSVETEGAAEQRTEALGALPGVALVVRPKQPGDGVGFVDRVLAALPGGACGAGRKRPRPRGHHLGAALEPRPSRGAGRARWRDAPSRVRDRWPALYFDQRAAQSPDPRARAERGALR